MAGGACSAFVILHSSFLRHWWGIGGAFVILSVGHSTGFVIAAAAARCPPSVLQWAPPAAQRRRLAMQATLNHVPVTAPAAPPPAPNVSLDDPSLYINRELSWLEFNRRVLEEAQDPRVPLLERLKFIAIVG